VYSSNPREGGYIELAIHGPLWAVQGHMGHSHIYTLTVVFVHLVILLGTLKKAHYHGKKFDMKSLVLY
jgi:hypothetical protein